MGGGRRDGGSIVRGAAPAGSGTEFFSGEGLVEEFRGRELEDYLVPLDDHGKGFDPVVLARCAGAVLQAEVLLVQRARYLGHVVLTAHDSSRKDKGFLVRAHVLGGIPLADRKSVV